MGFYSGMSIAQTKVLRRQVYLDIGFGQTSPKHLWALHDFFKHVVRSSGYNSSWKSSLPMKPSMPHYHCDSPSVLLREDRDCTPAIELTRESNLSKVFVRDMKVVGLLPGIYTLTPLSGSYPWDPAKKTNFTQNCQLYGTPTLTTDTQLHFEGFDLQHLLVIARKIFKDVTIVDACKSNKYFREVSYYQGAFFKNKSTSCEELPTILSGLLQQQQTHVTQ